MKKCFAIILVIFSLQNILASGLGGNTLIKTAKGTYIPIKELREGNQVIGYNISKQQFAIQRVQKITKCKVDKYCNVVLGDKNLIFDLNQTFFLKDIKVWGKILDLVPHINLGSNTIKIINKPIELYQVTVYPDHTFFINNDILVHNFVLMLAPVTFEVLPLFIQGVAITFSFYVGVKALLDYLGFGKNTPKFNKEIKFVGDDKKHILDDKQGEKHGFKGPGQDPEKWWQRILREIKEAYKQNKLRDVGKVWQIEVPQNENQEFGNLVIRGVIESGDIKIGTAFLRDKKWD